jgi:hypothetical protein
MSAVYPLSVHRRIERQTVHQQQPPDNAAAPDQATHPCPCCGARMNIIETFRRGSTPHHRPTGPITAVRIDTS